MRQSKQQHVAKKDLFNAFQRREGVQPFQIGHLFGGITCSHDAELLCCERVLPLHG